MPAFRASIPHPRESRLVSATEAVRHRGSDGSYKVALGKVADALVLAAQTKMRRRLFGRCCATLNCSGCAARSPRGTLNKALADPATRKSLEDQALVVVDSNADQLRAHFHAESKKSGDLIRSAKIVLE